MTEEQGLELPEEIIQHIHSFMERKQATQTSLLSKSRFKAWSTRPNLLFDPDDFRNGIFCDFGTTIVQRYLDLNINVSKLVLRPGYKHASLADKWIIDTPKLRINVLELCVWDGLYKLPPYTLPAEVFTYKYLKELCLSFCKIDYLIPGNVLCSNLRSMTLNGVSIDDSTFKNILVRCPIVEHLNLDTYLVGLTRLNASELINLKTLTVEYNALGCSAITPSVICGRFLNLSCLVLKDVSIADSFFTNISSSFPKLQDLTLQLNDYSLPDNHVKGIQISSHSIALLSLKYHGMLKMAIFDVPSIRNFKFRANHIPPLSFTASSKE